MYDKPVIYANDQQLSETSSRLPASLIRLIGASQMTEDFAAGTSSMANLSSMAGVVNGWMEVPSRLRPSIAAGCTKSPRISRSVIYVEFGHLWRISKT